MRRGFKVRVGDVAGHGDLSLPEVHLRHVCEVARVQLLLLLRDVRVRHLIGGSLRTSTGRDRSMTIIEGH